MKLKYIVPDMAQTFGNLEFAGENEVEQQRVNGRFVPVTRSYNLYSDIQRADDIIVVLPAKAGEKRFKYEQKVKLINPKITAEGNSTLIYYHLRMKVEKELVDIFELHPDDMTMLNQIIQKAFRCRETDPNYEKMREFRVFFTSRKTLLNEFNHFEGNMNIFQPAIDITKSALQKEITEIEEKLIEIKTFMQS